MKQLLLLILLLGATTNVAQSPKSEPVKFQQGKFKLIVPNARWEPIFFQPINERANLANLSTLRVALPKDDLELRIWNGFGLTALEGFVLRRKSGQWTAIHLDGIRSKLPKQQYQRRLPAPKSGWDECWRRLVEMGIFTLPDAAEIECSGLMHDGMSYVVEINHEFTYRTYMYDNPSYAKCEQAQRMISIANFIAEQFDVPEMATRK
jgi:hypothetical protein